MNFLFGLFFFILCVRVEGGDDHWDVHDSPNNNGCPKEFGGRCFCSYQQDKKSRNNRKYVVNCTDSVFTDTTVLKSLPIQTDELIFTGNQIDELPPNVFGMKDFPFLKVIDMSRNGIKDIKGKAFHHVTAVERLVLNFNKITNESLHNHPRVFSNFENLKELHLSGAFDGQIWSLSDLGDIFVESNLVKVEKLHLEQNNLELIPNRSLFCSLPSLTQLYLAQNRLTDVSIDTACLKNLDYIDASLNKIRSVPVTSSLLTILKDKQRILRVNLAKNPFVCDCDLDPFLAWIRNWTDKDVDRIIEHEHLSCESGLPETNKNLLLMEVDVTECPPAFALGDSSMTASLVWVICVSIALILLVFLYVRKGAACRRVSPLLAPNVSGVKYTSIEKNEEAEIAHV